MTTTASAEGEWTLDRQRAAFRGSRFLAMPLAGTIAWAVIGLAGFFLSPVPLVWTLFIATGSIFGLGLVIARWTGEDLLGRKGPENFFDQLFFSIVTMALMVYAIAIPFFLVDYTSLPLTVGILAGLMWLPFSVLLGHWVGTFHAIARTVLVLAAWYLFPERRFVVIPFVIVAVYLVTIWILERRPREIEADATPTA